MKNLDQIRANNALNHKDRIAASKGGGDAISGFPMLVLTDGLLAALAFGCQWKEIKERDLPPMNLRQQKIQEGFLRQDGNDWFARKQEGEFTVVRAIADHLNTASNRITASPSVDRLLEELAVQDSDVLLRRATAEALAFLNYLKRFVA